MFKNFEKELAERYRKIIEKKFIVIKFDGKTLRITQKTLFRVITSK